MSSSALISLLQVHKRFGQGTTVLQDVNLAVDAGEFVSLLGPSGCGKSTVLRLVSGLERASSGEVRSPALQGRDAPPTAFVFQDATLMPWATVFDNVWLPLRLQGVARAQAAPRLRALLAQVGLAHVEAAFPAELSGGMRMRASIARALLTEPAVLLMDEPFAALDEITRQKLNSDLLELWQRQQFAALFVTHSVFEAVFLSQRVVVMAAQPGRIVAEVRVDEPYPRSPAFRGSAAYAQACRALSQALEAAHLSGATAA